MKILSEFLKQITILNSLRLLKYYQYLLTNDFDKVLLSSQDSSKQKFKF